MLLFSKLYLIALFIFLGIDALWLGVLAKNLYQKQIGHLMADEIAWGAAVLFYLLYIAALVFFVILPALKEESFFIALTYGAFFGFICYATYDLTNWATLRGWPASIVVYDLLWGSFISSITSVITLWIILPKSH